MLFLLLFAAVVFDTPYDPSLELLLKLKCDFCVHGDDISTTADGKDAFAELKAAGRMKIVKRTEGVSTTDLVGRLLIMTKKHQGMEKEEEIQGATKKHNVVASAVGAAVAEPNKAEGNKSESGNGAAVAAAGATDVTNQSDVVSSRPISNFLPTTWRLTQFSNHKPPSASDKIVYIDGAFDLFHVGHIETLKAAKALGTFLYVGVHDDSTVNLHKGRNYPIMNLHERVMNVLSCRYVDEVVIGAPWIVSKDLLTTLNVDVVAAGSNGKMDKEREEAISAGAAAGSSNDGGSEGEKPRPPMADAYAEARAAGIFVEIETTHALTTEDVVSRLMQNRAEYAARNAKRAPKENAYFTGQKQFVQEI